MNESAPKSNIDVYPGYAQIKTKIEVEAGLIVGAKRDSKGIYVLIKKDDGRIEEKPLGGLDGVMKSNNPHWTKIEKALLKPRAFVDYNRPNK